MSGIGEHAVCIELPAAGGDFVDERRAGEVLDEVGVREDGGEMQVGREADGGVPAMRDEADAVFAGPSRRCGVLR